MKRIVTLLLSFAVLLTLAAGCNARTSKSFTFNVETGDQIKIKLNTADDYDLSSELPFTISCGGETLSQGIFLFADKYQEYVSVAQSDPDATVLDSGKKDGNEYVFWNYNDSEYNYVIMIKGSNTAILLGNPISEKSAKECFDRLTFSVVE